MMTTFMEELSDIKEDLTFTVAETFKIPPDNINANLINDGNMNYVFKFCSDEIKNSMAILTKKLLLIKYYKDYII